MLSTIDPKIIQTMKTTKLILASTSAIRKTLLTNAGLEFDTFSSPINEQAFKKTNSNMSSNELALVLANAKALSFQGTNRIVIGADQILSCQGKRYDKAQNRDELMTQLSELRGKTHTLHTAVAVTADNAVQWSCCVEAHLTMRSFSDKFLESYVMFHMPHLLQCVGGYQLESEGINLFEKIEGDYFAILGLPLIQLLAYLRRENYLMS